MPICEAPASRMTLRLLALAATAAALGGCLGEGGGAGFPLALPALGGGEAGRLAVAGGDVTVAGPPGYCIDRRLSRTEAEDAFVVMGSCSALGRGRAPEGVAGVLTATVSAAVMEQAPDPAALEAFFRSEPGLSAISRTGRPDTVAVLGSARGEGVLFLNIRDTAIDPDGPEVDPVYWRAVFVANGHLVSATTMGFRAQPMAPDAALRTLGAFVAAIRGATGGATAAEPVATAEPTRS